MLVVIDIGNARIKWARVVGGELTAAEGVLHSDARTRALEALAGSLPPRAERVLIANVGGEALGARVAELIRERLHVEPELAATRREQCGVRCAYTDPARLGVDRWLTVIAAYHHAGGAACVVGAGTAVTFDAVDARGSHLGGLIFAGPRITAEALERNTHNIGATGAAADRPDGLDVLARNTDDAVTRGALLALAAGVDRAAGIVKRSLGGELPLLLTGGDAERLEPWLETKGTVRPHMVLEGLALIAERG